MRILNVVGSSPPEACGVGDFVYSLSSQLRREGHEALLLTSRFPTSAISEDWVLRNVEAWGGGARDEFEAVIKQFRPEIIHVHFPSAGFAKTDGSALFSFLEGSGIPIVSTLHEYPPPPDHSSHVSWMYLVRASAAITYVRPNYEAHLLNLLSDDQITMRIPSAPSLRRASLSTSEEAEQKRKLHSQERRLVVTFGFNSESKRIDLLVDLIDFRRSKLLVIGPIGVAPDYMQKLVASISSKGGVPSDIFTGYLPPHEVSNLLRAADIACFLDEIGCGEWSTSLMSAQAQGTYCLATSVSRQGYVKEENTFYCLPSDVGTMRRVLSMMSYPKSSGYERSSWSEIATSLDCIYQKCTSR